MRELNIPVTTHGRLLIDDADKASPLRILAGCHGYAQSADEMMDLLRGISADASWTRVSIQALHRFYRGRSQTPVASWMTRQDRDLLIRDNVAYVDEAIAVTAGARPIEGLVFCGFSQGVAMAFRAGLLGARKADAILALGGDVPPELLADGPGSHLDSCVIDSSSTAPSNELWKSQKSRCDRRGTKFPRVLLARGTRDEWYAAEKMRADELALKTRGAHVETLTFDGAHEWHEDFAVRAAAMLSWHGRA
jgi:predicted esterase